jgi:hypothetical protein
MKSSTGGCAAFLNNPRSKFAQLAKDCLFERRRCVGSPCEHAGFTVEISNRNGDQSRSVDPSAGKAARRCGERAAMWIANAFLRGASITAHAIKRKAGSRCDMSCAPYPA